MSRTPAAAWIAAALAVPVHACFQPVQEPPVVDVAVADAGAVFSPDTGGNDAPRLGKDLAEGDAEVVQDSEDKPVDAVADTLDGAAAADAEPADVTATDVAADATATCGNATCDPGEDCAACPKDCGACPPLCGNAACDGDETCTSCPKDCGACPAPVCKVLTSQGCPAGQQCFPDGKANLCYAAGSTKNGDKCKQFNDCVVGVLCVAGYCRQLCDWTGKDAANLCKPGVPCDKLVFDGGAGEVGKNLGACKPSDPCNPLTDEGCAAGQTCTPTGWLKTCVAAGTGGVAGACTSQGACKPGLLCTDAGSGKKCLARCHTNGGAPACAAGDCKPVLGPDGKAVPEFVGVCN
ncbi:MAG: hypothetical protein FJ100_18795 [Deltaproteobacteria bacterium]|nr:hypothetical protein [Deltaproteobacteria bacterium]